MDIVSLITHVLTFILALYGDPNLPRKIVDDVIRFIHDFVRKVFVPSLKNDILIILKNAKIDDSTVKEIDRCFDKYSTLFEIVDTEAKRFKLLRKRGFIEFEEFRVGTGFTEKIVGNETLIVPENLYGVYIPLRESLKVFLEIPGLFDQIMQNIRKVSQESHIITNIIQADVWKTKYFEKFKNDIFLPLFIFYDDLEVGNPLGSHAGTNKFAAIYAQIACLPPRITSRLHSILFSTLVRSADKTNSKNETVFRKLIEELNFLNTEGILINVKGVMKRIKFQLVLVLGDNLGLNGIFGFVESFRTNNFCRICKGTVEEYSKMCVEEESKLRTKSSYEKDVHEADVAKSGIKEQCVFNKVNGFHLTENITVDMMHDVLEGVCTYLMRSLLYTLIFVKKYFTVQQLNTRIKNFDFGPTGNSNRPPTITMSRVLNTVTLRMSASEMLNFVRYFGLIVGDLVPENDSHWTLYTYLRQILDIILSPRVIRSDAKILKKLIENLNKLYLKLYGDLKPKFHFLVHYPRALLNNGPIVNFWGMRFESSHRPLKITAQSTSNKKDLLKTIATKQALKMCEMMNSIEFDEAIKFGAFNNINIEKTYFSDEKQNILCAYYKQINIEGIQYKIGTYVVTNTKDSEVEFGEITDIVCSQDEIYFHVNVFKEITFHFHCHAYIVECNDVSRLVKQKDLPRIAPVLSIIQNNTHFIATKYGL